MKHCVRTQNFNQDKNIPMSKSKNKKKYQDEYIKVDFCKQVGPVSIMQGQQSVQMQEQYIPNTKVPFPITQTKLTQTHCNLQQIPLILYIQTRNNPKQEISSSKQKQKHKSHLSEVSKQINKDYIAENIRQLYLSHNRIKSVRNKLRYFESLKNLNISYNLLTDVDEFVNQIIGNYEDEENNNRKYNSVQSCKINMMSSFQTFGIVNNQDQQSNKNKNKNKNKKIINLKMLYLRMNKFPYGYEDIIIKNIKSITRFQDYHFKQISRTKDEAYIYGVDNDRQCWNGNIMSGCQVLDRQQLYVVANKVSQFFIPAINRLKNVLDQFTLFYQCIAKLSSKTAIKQEWNNYHKHIQQKYQKIVVKLCQYVGGNSDKRRKQIKYMPLSRQSTLNKLLQYEAVCLGLQDMEQNQNFIHHTVYMGSHDQPVIKPTINKTQLKNNTTVSIFVQIFRLILIKFNKRNNHQLLKTLQAQIHNKHPDQQDISQLADTFGKYYKGQQYKIYQQHPGKYIQKISTHRIHQHPYMHYLQSNIQQRQKQQQISQNISKPVMTLDGNRPKTKNTVVRELIKYGGYVQNEDCHNLLTHNCNKQSVQDGGIYYERMPIIIWDRNYLQVIIEIWQDYFRQFAKIYDIISNKMTNMQKQGIEREKNLKTQENSKYQHSRINNQSTIKNTKYLQQNQLREDKNENINRSVIEFGLLGKEGIELDRKLILDQWSALQYKNQGEHQRKSNVEHKIQMDKDKDNYSFCIESKSNQLKDKEQQQQYIKIQQQCKTQKADYIGSNEVKNIDQYQGQHSEYSDIKFKQIRQQYQDRKTLPKFYDKNKSKDKNGMKTKKHSKNTSSEQGVLLANRRSYISQKQQNLINTITTSKQKYYPIKQNQIGFKMKKNNSIEQYQVNFDKFTIYQINLAYKVFMVLKINRNKNRKKKLNKKISSQPR